MLAIEDLVVRYGTGRGALTAVDSVTFRVPDGGTLGLVGESGSGKSTIARAVVGLVPIAGGRITLDGEDVSSARARSTPAYRRRVQMVFQDPYASLNPRMTIESALCEALARRRDVPRAGRTSEAVRLLDLVGLGRSTLPRYPHEFSGGQRQRIAIARALSVRPEIIIMDEVTSALDVSVQATILQLLKDLQSELGVAYLFISHDLAVVGLMSSVTAVMYLGRVVEHAATDELFASPRHPYTQGLIDSVPSFGTEHRPAAVRGDLPDPRDPPTGCRFHTRCARGPLRFPDRDVCRAQDPQEIAEGMPHRAACHFATDDRAPAVDAAGTVRP